MKELQVRKSENAAKKLKLQRLNNDSEKVKFYKA